jgi:membrane-bound lytic murein transglycosylase D
MTTLPANPNVRLMLVSLLLLLIQFPLQSQHLDERLTSNVQASAYTHPTIQLSADSLTSSVAGLPQPTSVARIEGKITENKRNLAPISPLRNNKITKKMLTAFTGRERRFITAMQQQRHQYFPIFEQLLKQYELPDELKYISVIESGLNYRARSRCKAVGLWQFMSATGKQYQLYQDAYIDERLDPYKATEAACCYLKDLYQRFGNWELALAAYNCGPGNVRKAIRRSGNQTSFWKIAPYLPSEARAYVPKFAVVHHLMTQGLSDTLSEHNWFEPQPFDTILVSQYVDLKQLAGQLDMSLAALVKLNPQVKRNVIPGYLKGYVVKIPSEKKAFFDLY